MRRVFGISCIVLGICCLIASVGFIVYNRWEAEYAQKASTDILLDLQESITDHTHQEPAPEETAEVLQEMPVTQVGGFDCIGILSIPVLELELPVLTQWDYAKLKIAPCLYYGSCNEKDFVIAAHNYRSHFGRLSELQPGDIVIFTDVNGMDRCYEVVLLETLPGNATEEMITAGFDLSLYTCTPGGADRVTVRCNIAAGI